MVDAPTNQIVFKDEKNGQRFVFPVNPPRITIRNGRQFNEVPIVNLGVALLAGPVNPEEISFESFLPRAFDPSFTNYTQLEVPEDSIERLLVWMGKPASSNKGGALPATPLRVTITGTQFSQLMVITDIQHSYMGGEPDAIYFQISMRKWLRQRVRVEEADEGGGSSSEGPREEPPFAGTTHKVVKGDTLWLLAKRFYNSGSKWDTIYQANKKLIGNNPNIIRPGQQLEIP